MRMARTCTPLLESTHRCTLTSAAASGVSPLPFQMHTPSPHLRWDRAHTLSTSAPGRGSPPATSAPGWGSRPAHTWPGPVARPCHTCAVTGPAQHGPTWPEHIRLVLAAQQAQQLCATAEAAACRADREPPGLGSTLVQHLHWDRAHPCPHLRRDWPPRLPHLHRDGAHLSHIGIGIRTGRLLTPSAPGVCSPHAHLRRDRAYPLHISTGAHPCHIFTGTRLVSCITCAMMQSKGARWLCQPGIPGYRIDATG